MSLTPGARFGPYEITAPLGAGGMGEVYRARDSNLGREVAVKVLPAALAADADYLARFQREAQVLASLNHPNIAAIYGLEESAIVMELVEGETLRGPLPLAEALPLARQIAEALEAAHEKGIVHRDLKPGNIKITPEGVVKVLDFGLAKSVETTSHAAVANSPTLTMRSTQIGIILGTAGYMSPEQAAGKPVDKRADIWSFGVVLWELLTGGSMFEGETVSHTLAHVLTREVKLSDAPPSVRPLLARCLDRNVKTRLRDIGEARVAIDKILAGPAEVPAPAAIPARRSWPGWAASIACTAAALAAGWYLRPLPQPEVVELEIAPPKNGALSRAAFSPDGRKLLYESYAQGATGFYLRSLDQAQPRPVAGLTNVVGSPFWSADSRKIAFFSAGKLKALDLETGGVQDLCDALAGTREGAWSSSGEILLNVDSQLKRIPETGGQPQPVLPMDTGRSEAAQRAPAFLPDGRHFVYYSTAARDPGIYIASLDGGTPQLLDGGAFRPSRIVRGGSTGDYYLMHVRGTQLVARRFDIAKKRLIGNEVLVATAQLASGFFSASQNGHLAIIRQQIGSGRLTWFSRDARSLKNAAESADYMEIRLSPDGQRAAFTRYSMQNVWVLDVERGSASKLTFGSGSNRGPVWSPDGRQIAYASSGQPPYRIHRRASDGTGSEELLLESTEAVVPLSWSPNGGFLLYITGLRGRWDHYLLPLSGDRKPIPYMVDPYDKFEGVFSPDGHWIAYSSNETGQREVYVRPAPEIAGGLPGAQGKWLISSQGGFHPRWRRDGKELVFFSLSGGMLSASLETSGNSFRHSIPQPFPLQIGSAVNPLFTHDMAPDGKSFLLVDRDTATTPITIVLNWEARLQRR
jgi:eukaryotic-like serine/threonine-protein kinase